MTGVVPPEGALFLAILEVLRRHRCRHLLVRNHERYPHVFTGDVDLYVELDRLRDAGAELRAACESTGWDLVKLVSRPWVTVLQCVRVGTVRDRRVMVIELFDRFTWLGFPYADFDAIWNESQERNGMRVLDGDLGMVVTIAHYLYWAGFLPSKYQERIRRAAAADGFDRNLRLVFPGRRGQVARRWLERYLRVEADGWERRKDVPEPLLNADDGLQSRLRGAAVVSMARGRPLRSLAQAAVIVGLRLQELIAISGRVLVVEDRAWDLLRITKQYHLFKNRTSAVVVVGGHGGGAALRAVPRIYWIVARGGLAVVQLPEAARAERQWLRRVFRGDMRTVRSLASAADATLLDAAVGALK